MFVHEKTGKVAEEAEVMVKAETVVNHSAWVVVIFGRFSHTIHKERGFQNRH